MANFITTESAGCLRTGDIIEVPSRIPNTKITFPMVTHYGIISHVCGVPYVSHLTVGKTPQFEALADFKKRRKILRVLRNGDTEKLTDEELVNRYYEHKDTVYDFFSLNCEDYVTSLCPTDIGFDQRKGYFIGLLIIVFLVYVFYQMLRKR